MKLPKISYPTFTTILPWSKKEITYRPYSVKEEKMLMMASSDENISDEDVLKGVTQVIENCCSVDIETLHPVDVEWLFIKLKSVSDTPILEVTFFPPTCSTENCPDELNAYINLDKAVVEGLSDLEEYGFKRKGDHWIIMLTDTVGIKLNDLKESKSDRSTSQLILDSIESIFNEEEVWPTKDLDKSELIAFVEDLTPNDSTNLKKFFELQPRLTAEIVAICPVCKKTHENKITGLTNFFE